MPDSTQHNATETSDPRCRWCGGALSISSSTAEDWQLDFCSCLCRDNYWRTQEAEEEEAAERAAGPLFRAQRTEERSEDGSSSSGLAYADDWVILRRDPTRVPRCRRCARPPITTSITAEHWQRLFCSQRCREEYTRDAEEELESRRRRAEEGEVRNLPATPDLPTFSSEQGPRTSPDWLRRILNWRPVERTRDDPTWWNIQEAPEGEEQGSEGDGGQEDTTTCPGSDSTEGHAPSYATEEDDGSISIQADERSTTSASTPSEKSCE